MTNPPTPDRVGRPRYLDGDRQLDHPRLDRSGSSEARSLIDRVRVSGSTSPLESSVLSSAVFSSDLFGASGVTGLNIYSMIVAVVGSVVVLLIYNAVMGRRRA